MATPKTITPVLPPHVQVGQRTRAKTINDLIDAHGTRTIRPNKMPYEPAPQRYPFQIEKASTTSITIRCGRYNRYAGGDHVALSLTKDGGGTSDDMDILKTITGLNAASTTYYVHLTLNDHLNPSTLVVEDPPPTGYPTGDTTKLKFVIGTVTTNSSSVISEVQQWWTGGHIEDFYLAVDGISTEYHSDDKLQIHAYNGGAPATTATDAANDKICFHDATTPDVRWMDTTGLANMLVGTGGEWSSGNAPWEQANAVDHGDLAGLNDGTDDGDHLWAWCNAGNGASGTYVDTYLRNFGESIGETSGPHMVIDLTNELLVRANAQNALDWANSQLLESGAAAMTLDWDARQFDGADWTFLDGTLVKMLDTTDVTVGTPNNGESCYCAGGLSVNNTIQADGFYLHDSTTNEWVDSTLAADVTGNIILTAAGDVRLVASTDIDFTPTGAINWSGAPGMTITNWTSDGGVIGSSIVESAIGDLNPNDKVLAILT
jgi:hypothetical protein